MVWIKLVSYFKCALNEFRKITTIFWNLPINLGYILFQICYRIFLVAYNSKADLIPFADKKILFILWTSFLKTSDSEWFKTEKECKLVQHCQVYQGKSLSLCVFKRLNFFGIFGNVIFWNTLSLCELVCYQAFLYIVNIFQPNWFLWTFIRIFRNCTKCYSK